MVRTQIMLTEHQHTVLRAMAHESGVSLAEVVRVAVQRLLDERDTLKWAAVRELFGAFEDSEPDVSENHDRYIVEGISE